MSKKFSKLGKILIIAVAAVAALVILFGSSYQVREQEQAVLITLGKAKAVTDPGLHFKLPLIQKVRKVNTTIQGFSIGYNTDSNESNMEESLMITSDYNFVNVDFFVEYRVSDPESSLRFQESQRHSAQHLPEQYPYGYR